MNFENAVCEMVAILAGVVGVGAGMGLETQYTITPKTVNVTNAKHQEATRWAYLCIISCMVPYCMINKQNEHHKW